MERSKESLRPLSLSYLTGVSVEPTNLASESGASDLCLNDDALRHAAGWVGQYETSEGISGSPDGDILAAAAKSVALAALRISFHGQSIGAMTPEDDEDDSFLSGLQRPSFGVKDEEEEERSASGTASALHCLVTDASDSAQYPVAVPTTAPSDGETARGARESHSLGALGNGGGGIREGESIILRSRDQEIARVFQCQESVIGKLGVGDEEAERCATPRPKRLDDGLVEEGQPIGPQSDQNVTRKDLEVFEARMMERFERMRLSVMKVHTVLCEVLARPSRGNGEKMDQLQNCVSLLIEAANFLEQTPQSHLASDCGAGKAATVVEADSRGPPSQSYSTCLEESASNLTLDSLRTVTGFSRAGSLSHLTPHQAWKVSGDRTNSSTASAQPRQSPAPRWSHAEVDQVIADEAGSPKREVHGALTTQAVSHSAEAVRVRDQSRLNIHPHRAGAAPQDVQKVSLLDSLHFAGKDPRGIDSGGLTTAKLSHFQPPPGSAGLGCSLTGLGRDISSAEIAANFPEHSSPREGRDITRSTTRWGSPQPGKDLLGVGLQPRCSDEAGGRVIEQASFDTVIQNSGSLENVGALEAIATLSSLASCVGIKNQSSAESVLSGAPKAPPVDPTLFAAGGNCQQRRNLLEWLVSQTRTLSGRDSGSGNLEETVQRSSSTPNVRAVGRQSGGLLVANQNNSLQVPGSLGGSISSLPGGRSARDDTDVRGGGELAIGIADMRPIDQTHARGLGERKDYSAFQSASVEEMRKEQNDGVGTGRMDWIASAGGCGNQVMSAVLQRRGPRFQPPQQASEEILEFVFNKMFERLEILVRLTPELLHLLPDPGVLRRIERENRLTVHVFSAVMDSREVNYADFNVVSNRNAAVFIAPALNRISCSTLNSMLHFCNEQRLVPSIARLAMIGSNCFSGESGRKWMKKCFQEAIRSLVQSNSQLYKVVSVGTRSSSPRTGPHGIGRERQESADLGTSRGESAGDSQTMGEGSAQDGRSSAAEEIVVLNASHDRLMEIYKSSGGEPAPFIRPGDPTSQCSEEIWKTFVMFLDRQVTQPQNGRYGVAMTAKYTGPPALNCLPLGLLEWMVQLALSRTLLNYDSRSRCVWVNRPLNAREFTGTEGDRKCCTPEVVSSPQ